MIFLFAASTFQLILATESDEDMHNMTFPYVSADDNIMAFGDAQMRDTTPPIIPTSSTRARGRTPHEGLAGSCCMGRTWSAFRTSQLGELLLSAPLSPTHSQLTMVIMKPLPATPTP